MNDLELLDAHGPAPTLLRSEVLARSRDALTQEAAHATPADTPTTADAAVRRLGMLTRRGLASGAVAASAAVAALVGPSLLGTNGSEAVALAPSDPLLFPLTPIAVPEGLGGPIFEMDSGFMSARYGARSVNGLTVTTSVEDEDFFDIPVDTQSVEVAGHEAVLFESVAYQGTRDGITTVSVVWQDDDGVWTRVAGRGEYADSNSVESFADSLRERPQPVDLALAVAPEGWSVDAYKEDRFLMLSPEGETGDLNLTISLMDHPPRDFASAYGVEDVTTVEVHDATAKIGQHADSWMVLAATSEGQSYLVTAPLSLTRDQVVAVADGVTVAP